MRHRFKKRVKLSRRHSRRNFRKGHKVHRRNVHKHPMRGGIRF